MFKLTVPRAGLEDAFRLLRRLCKPKKGEEAVLSFDGACLHIECAGMTVTPAAQGEWPAQVRMSSEFLLTLAKIPPSGDPVSFSVSEGHLSIGSTSITCTVQPAWSKTIELPMNATPAQIFAPRFTHTPAEIEAAGYSKTVAQARGWADGQIAKAAKSLKGLPIAPAELESFVYGTMQRKISEGFSVT